MQFCLGPIYWDIAETDIASQNENCVLGRARQGKRSAVEKHSLACTHAISEAPWGMGSLKGTEWLDSETDAACCSPVMPACDGGGGVGSSRTAVEDDALNLQATSAETIGAFKSVA